MVRSKGLVSGLALAILLGCGAKSPAARPAATPGQRVTADVVVVREVLPSEKKAFVFLIAHSQGKVRLGNEVDQWRLIDLNASTVTFIDESTKSFRIQSLGAVKAARRSAVLRPLPPPFKPYSLVRTGETTTIAKRGAVRHVIEGGGYRREVWLSTAPVLHSELFPAMLASDTISEPFAGLMREATPRLMAQQGFPLRDESELAYGDKKLHVIRTVTEIGQRKVPASWFTVPTDYEDRGVTAPGAGRRSGESRPSGRGAPAAGSRSSATNRTSP